MRHKDRRFELHGAHVVAAVAGMEHGTAARIFDMLGIDRASAPAAAEHELAGRPCWRSRPIDSTVS